MVTFIMHQVIVYTMYCASHLYLFITVTTTSTVSSVDEHSALSRGNNNTYNSVSEVTHNTLISDVKPSPCDSELFSFLEYAIFTTTPT